MKGRKLIGAALTLATFGGAAWAQEPPPPGEGGEGRRPPRPTIREPREPGPMQPPGAREGEPPSPPRGGPREPFGGRGGREGMPELSPAQIDRILAFLQDHDPERAEKLKQLRERDPQSFLRLIREVGDQIRHTERLRETDPAEHERMTKMLSMEREIQQIAEKSRQAESADDRAKLKERLKERLSALFDLRESGREREVVELEKRLAELKKILKERRERKAEIVERRIGQLMGKQEVLEW
jgi:hypothetical protein